MLCTAPGDLPLEGAVVGTKTQRPYSPFANISHEEANAIFKSVQSKPHEVGLPTATATTATRHRVLASWNEFVGVKLKRDPGQVWFDLCAETEDAIDICRAFLEVYVKSSWRKRLSLGPQEYEWVYEITCPESVNTVWKALVAEADDKVLRPARQKARKKAELRGQAKIWRLKRGKHGVGAHDEGVVSVVANWIFDELAEQYSLKSSDYKKVEMTPADLLLFLRTLWVRGDHIPCTPLVRVSFNGVITTLGIGGFRRNMVLGMKFAQVQLAVIRDPERHTRPRLAVTITVFRNKLKRAARGKSRSSKQLEFTVTIVPQPLICLATLIASSAIHQGAFEHPFSSVDEILDRPYLEDVNYVPLLWKMSAMKMRVFPISEGLFGQLWHRTWVVAGCRDPPRPYAMRIGTAARLDGVLKPALRNYIISQTTAVFEKSYQTEHIRDNLTALTFKKVKKDCRFFERLRDVSLTADPNAPIYPTDEQLKMIEGREDLMALQTNKRKYRAHRQKLWDLAIQLNREKYFAEADSLRALGKSTAHLRLSVNPPQPLSWLHQRLDLAPFVEAGRSQPGSTADDSRIATNWVVNYLRKNWAALELPPPPDSPVVRHTSTCLCCGDTFGERKSLTRHCKTAHVKHGLFDSPYECPECIRRGFPDRIVNSPSEWSNHVERVHGKLHAPNLTAQGLQRRSSRRCLLCDDTPETTFERHFSLIHVAAGLFSQHFPCPECRRLGLPDSMIDGLDGWYQHTANLHAERLRLRCLLCSKFYDKTGLSAHVIRAHASVYPLPCPECRRCGVACPPDIQDYQMWRVHVALKHNEGNADGSTAQNLRKRKQDDGDSLSNILPGEITNDHTPIKRIKLKTGSIPSLYSASSSDNIGNNSGDSDGSDSSESDSSESDSSDSSDGESSDGDGSDGSD